MYGPTICPTFAQGEVAGVVGVAGAELGHGEVPGNGLWLSRTVVFCRGSGAELELELGIASGGVTLPPSWISSIT